MNRKTLIVLALLLAALSAGLWFANREAGRLPGDTRNSGDAWLGEADLSTLRSISIVKDGMGVRIERIDGTWCVAEKGDYPADLDRLRQMVQAIETPGAAQAVDPGGGRPDIYGLADDEEGAGPATIKLEHAKGTTSLRLGKAREPRRPGDMWGPPPGRYAQVDGGVIVLLKDDIPHANADPELWWDRVLLSVDAESLEEVRVESAGEVYAIRREEGGSFQLVDGSEREEVEAGAARRLFGALGHLRADRIIPAEEISYPEGESETTRYEATAGAEKYVLEVGKPLANSSGSRPVRIVSPERRHFAGRWFQVPAYLSDSLGMERSVVVREKEQAPVPPPLPGEREKAEVAEVDADANSIADSSPEDELVVAVEAGGGEEAAELE